MVTQKTDKEGMTTATHQSVHSKLCEPCHFYELWLGGGLKAKRIDHTAFEFLNRHPLSPDLMAVVHAKKLLNKNDKT